MHALLLGLLAVSAGAADKTVKEAAYELVCQDFFKDGQFDLALATCRKCLKIKPSSTRCLAALKLAEGRVKASGPQAEGKAEEPLPDQQRMAAQHYLAGVIFFQKTDYAKARSEWTLCRELDPGNEDCRMGLERLELLERREK